MHAPFAQVSAVVQTFPSLHGLVLFALMQPVAGAQLSSVQGLLSLQSRGVAPARQVPPPQVSPTVQAFPSLQGLVLLALMQPVAGSQESSVQGLLSLHARDVAPA
jgi:hypothetical protein